MQCERAIGRAADERIRVTIAAARILPPAENLSEATQAYFDKCVEKLGLVPNVLLAYAFDDRTSSTPSPAMYNDLMLGAVGPDQARARDDRGRRLGR